MISKHRVFAGMFVVAIAAFSPSCKNTDPGAAGDACNFDAPGTDGCDAESICNSGTCYKTCSSPSSSSSECGGGGCVAYERTYGGDKFTACSSPTGGGGPSGSGAGTGSGNPSCSNSCTSACTGNVPEQACLYCQAACLCRCAGNNACATQNAASACQLGTCGC